MIKAKSFLDKIYLFLNFGKEELKSQKPFFSDAAMRFRLFTDSIEEIIIFFIIILIISISFILKSLLLHLSIIYALNQYCNGQIIIIKTLESFN